MLQFENVSTFYGKIQALHSVNVEINQGEIVTVSYTHLRAHET